MLHHYHNNVTDSIPFSNHISLHYALGIYKTTLMSTETSNLFMGQLKGCFYLITKNTNRDYLIIQLAPGVKILMKWPYILSSELSMGGIMYANLCIPLCIFWETLETTQLILRAKVTRGLTRTFLLGVHVHEVAAKPMQEFNSVAVQQTCSELINAVRWVR
jgi:hypothetical protein